VVQISEVLPVDEHYRYRLEDVFVMRLPEGGRKLEEGALQWTGHRPALMDEVQGRMMAQETESLAPLFADKS